MNRRQWLLAPAAISAGCASVAQTTPTEPMQRCAGAHPGLGRGFHLGEAFGRTLQDFQGMARAGATLARFGIALWPDALGQRWLMHDAAMPELLRQLDFARATHMRLVLVLRPPTEPPSPLWSSAALQTGLEALWRSLARQLAGRRELAAFDLVNEPHPDGMNFWLKQRTWNALAERLARAVRAEDPARTLVAEPSPGARPMAFDTAKPLALGNVVYSVHMYEPFQFTHQRVIESLTGVVDYPGPVPGLGQWNRARLAQELAPVKRFADSHGVEIFVGEFGAARWTPGASRERYLRDLTAIFAAWRWSWTYHAWREWHGWDAEMAAGVREGPAAGQRRDAEPALAVLRDALNDCGSGDGKR